MVPNGWERKPLEKVAEIKTGVAKGKKGLKDPIEVPYLRVANVQDGHIDLSEVKTIQIERHQLERYSLQVGDVLMTEGGDFDKLGRGDVWQGQIAPCLNQNHVFAVRPNKQLLLPYFLAALSGSNYGKTYFLSCAKRSTNLASINSTQLKEFPVLLPPLPEQRKIAEILSTWDRGIATTEKLIDASKQQKKALMQQLLTGKKRLIDPETGKAFEGEWKTIKIKDVFKAKTTRAKDSNYTTYSVTKSGIVSQEDYFNKSVASQDTSNYKVIEFGDFVMSGLNFWMGSVDIYLNKTKGIISPAYKTFSVSNDVDLKFMYQFVRSDKFNQILVDSSIVGASVVRRNFNSDVFFNWGIGLPSMREQQKIASVLTTSDKEIELLVAKLAHFKQEKKALMQQLLTGTRRVKVAETEVA